jgi:hypothetical protein
MDIFEPVNTANNTLGIISLVLGLLAFSALIYLIKNPPAAIAKQFRPLAQLLVFIVFLLGICTAFFSFWTNQKLGPVTITKEYLETSRGRVAWKDIDRIYIHQDQQLSPLTSQEYGKPIRFLMIVESKDARTHALSEENYDLEAISSSIEAMRPNR